MTLIFGTVKKNFMELSTRVLISDTYDEIKQRVIAEYGQIYLEKSSDLPCLWHAGTLMEN